MTSPSPLDNPSVQRVQEALAAAGSEIRVRELADTARSAQEAADTLEVALGAIVKSLLFMAGEVPVMALVSGDRRCNTKALAGALAMPGRVRRASADQVRAATGFAIGGVAPLGHPAPIPIAIDAGLQRFDTIYAAAGHPFCVFPISPADLVRLTGGTVSSLIGDVTSS